jgi:HD-GYP domain-containing protein (c-di-GMP phosphodiesterase class II)
LINRAGDILATGQPAAPPAETERLPLQEHLREIHASLQDESIDIDRVAVAIYDRRTDLLKTFVHSTLGEVPFLHHQAKLADVPSLAALARDQKDRVVQDLCAPGRLPGEHDRQLIASGLRSSYTRPFYYRDELFGFAFFDSRRANYFTESLIRHLAVYTRLVSLAIVNALAPASVLRSAVEIAREMSHFRDEETGAHLDRMARYARLIANGLAERFGLDDEFIEFVFLFAPLHDVGKIAVPDRILLKPGKLTDEELAVMRRHVDKGIAIIDAMARSFGVGRLQHVEMLRNIVQYHHEHADGSGYPHGLAGDQIPLEARIVCVADVFDALTTNRPYKLAWSNADAFAFLSDRAGRTFDAACVAALREREAEVVAIQDRFRFAKGDFEGFHEAYLEQV